jgi:type I site-specific restriction endonuclease
MFARLLGALEEKASIPMVRAELELIIEVQTDEFWQDITASMLEDVRKRLRSLVKFIEKDEASEYLHGLCGLDRRGERNRFAGIRCRT